MPETNPQHEETQPQAPTRRGLLGWTAAIAAAVGAMVGFPVGGLFAAPLFRKGAEGTWVPVGTVDEFGDEVQEVVKSYQQQDGWYEATRTMRVVVNQEGEGQFRVLSTECTHLNCGVTWRPDEQIFYCPCHGGEFNADGTVKKGPPTEPLKKLEWRVNADTNQLEVLET